MASKKWEVMDMTDKELEDWLFHITHEIKWRKIVKQANEEVAKNE